MQELGPNKNYVVHHEGVSPRDPTPETNILQDIGIVRSLIREPYDVSLCKNCIKAKCLYISIYATNID